MQLRIWITPEKKNSQFFQSHTNYSASTFETFVSLKGINQKMLNTMWNTKGDLPPSIQWKWLGPKLSISKTDNKASSNYDYSEALYDLQAID